MLTVPPVLPSNFGVSYAFRPMNMRFYILMLTVLFAVRVSADEQAAVRGFLKAHCYDCHSGDSVEAGLNLEQLKFDLDDSNVDQWIHIVDRVSAGEMPPPDSSTVKQADVNRFANATSLRIKQHQQREQQELGRVKARRLTNTQLERTLHDLLGIDIPLASLMPEEPRTNGFASVASGQSISHFQLQTHLSVVDAALDEAFRRATSEPDEFTKVLPAKMVARQNPKRRCREPEMLNGSAVVWSGNTTFYGRLPVTTARRDGWYRIAVTASGLNVPSSNGVWCSVRTGQCVSGSPLLGWAGAFEVTDEPKTWTFEAWLKKDDMFEIRPADSTLKQGRFAGGQIGAGEGTPQNLAGVAIHEMTLERFHKGPSNSEIQALLFGDLQLSDAGRNKSAGEKSELNETRVTELLTRFASRAFRRPVSQSTIQPYVELVMDSLANGTDSVNAVRGGYRAVLCSPRFMYFQEDPGQLDDFALANRLSYLLWSSMPDQRLMDVAAAGKLKNADVLRQQVNRMLKDHRGANFVKDFAHEWLELSEIDFTEPDRRLYPGFDVIVQESMLQETQTFLQHMLENDLSVSNLIDSDFTFLNNRLARYYKIEAVSGDSMQKVALQDEHHRGGVLTQGAIMKVTANGTTTSPVLRGIWVSERLLGEEIPPPPTSVPAIEPDIRGAKTIREMLAKHTSDTSCASCHRKIDPPGFALEHFDPSGRWRTTYRTASRKTGVKGLPIDPAHQMPTGEQFTSLKEFQQIASQKKKALAENVVRQLLTYGTGAPCSFVDREGVTAIAESTEKYDYGFKSLLMAVVQSQIMQSK